MKNIILAAILMISPITAFAQSCGPSDLVKKYLEEQFKEFPHFEGIDSVGRVVELFGNEDTGTWTMVLTTPDGTSCLISAGENFYENPHPPNV